jgi:hypothetical protein
MDVFCVNRKKWNDLRDRIKDIVKGDQVIWVWAIGGLFVGVLIMAAFGTYYSKDTLGIVSATKCAGECAGRIAINNSSIISIPILGRQSIFHLYSSVLAGAFFGIVYWLISYQRLLKPIIEEKNEIAKEMDQKTEGHEDK